MFRLLAASALPANAATITICNTTTVGLIGTTAKKPLSTVNGDGGSGAPRRRNARRQARGRRRCARPRLIMPTVRRVDRRPLLTTTPAAGPRSAVTEAKNCEPSIDVLPAHRPAPQKSRAFSEQARLFCGDNSVTPSRTSSRAIWCSGHAARRQSQESTGPPPPGIGSSQHAGRVGATRQIATSPRGSERSSVPARPSTLDNCHT
jgi:hypothetical protein